MFTALFQQLRGRSSRAAETQFQQAIERYERERLSPLGLGFTQGTTPLQTKKNRRVLGGERLVWKFYRPVQRRFARNFAAAVKILDAHGIAAPKILHMEADQATHEKYGLCALVMERVVGEALTKSMTPIDWGELGTFLSRLHGIQSASWGTCRKLRSDDFGTYYMGSSLEESFGVIEPWLAAKGEKPLLCRSLLRLPDFGRYGSHGSSYSFVTGDANPGNFFRLPQGGLCVIDLDLARYADFPSELTYALFYPRALDFNPEEASAAEIIKAFEHASHPFLDSYFAPLPASYREHWTQFRWLFFHRAAIWNLWNVIKSAQPAYNDVREQSPHDLAVRTRHALAILRAFDIQKPG